MRLGIAGNLKKRPTSLPTRWPWLQTVVVQTRQLCTSRQRLRQSARHRPQKGVAHSWLAGMPSTQCDHQWGREAPNLGLLFCGHCLWHSMVQQGGITHIAAKIGKRQKDALRRENGVPDGAAPRGRGGTGRHTGLKILRGRPRAGSTPAVRTKRFGTKTCGSQTPVAAGDCAITTAHWPRLPEGWKPSNFVLPKPAAGWPSAQAAIACDCSLSHSEGATIDWMNKSSRLFGAAL
jgi:hypothetical protein